MKMMIKKIKGGKAEYRSDKYTSTIPKIRKVTCEDKKFRCQFVNTGKIAICCKCEQKVARSDDYNENPLELLRPALRSQPINNYNANSSN